METSPLSPAEDRLTHEIIGGSFEVHDFLKNGMFESTYEACLARELTLRGLSVERQVPVPLVYKSCHLEVGYRIDLLVERTVLVEVKSVERLHPITTAQVVTYLRLSGLHVGLILNFNVERMKDGIRRIVL
ncbi:MAG: GxxExxY protein [Gemmatimonadaceae bacterium]|nr:GxxExxY protein [Gemmatimonadaceae bacterium]NUQ92565.1 GxxExxY protein [Gemmatimonadaceae bacterium]NUR18790.1 GxxExxY protein [Gemmatimonadaceae bacterium]NUS97387.1 GxxExxY protein [Gemmatimonadaceae bacterium]